MTQFENKISWCLSLTVLKKIVLHKQKLLQELADRFGLKSTLFKRAQIKASNILSIKLIAIEILFKNCVLNYINLNQKTFLIKKNQILKKLKNIDGLNFNRSIKKRLFRNNAKLLNITDKVIQQLFKLVSTPLFSKWKNNCIKKILKKLKIKIITKQKLNNFYFLKGHLKLFYEEFFYKWIRNTFSLFMDPKKTVKEWLKSYNWNETKNTSIMLALIHFLLKNLNNEISKSLLALIVKNIYSKSKIFLLKTKLKYQKVIVSVKRFLFLKFNLIYFSNSFNILCNNFAVIRNLIVPQLKNFFKKIGVCVAIGHIKSFKLKLNKFSLGKYILVCSSKKKELNTFCIKLNVNSIFYLKKKLKKILYYNNFISVSQIVFKLNNILYMWYKFFKLGISSILFKHLTNYLFKLWWLWINKKYFKWSKDLIWKYYFKHTKKTIFPRLWPNTILLSNLNILKSKKKHLYVLNLKRFSSI